MTEDRQTAAAALAFLPRALSRRLGELAAAGAPAEILLRRAAEIDRTGVWRPPPGMLARELVALRLTGTKLVQAGDESYPSLLKHIPDPPLCLHVRGRLPAGLATAVAIVGSRLSVGNSISFAADLARGLARAGVTVVSGMARGIDSAAHAGCLDGGAPTVAVLGCGVDVCYPRENKKLMNRILESGALISEYPMGAHPAPFHFPERNRIISGCCAGTVVVQAGRGSGALVTARFAAEQDRSVFAVPGAVWNPLSEGPNDLIRDGAIPVRRPEDVLEEIGGVLPRWAEGRSCDSPALRAQERNVLAALDYDEARHVDTVARTAGLTAAGALALLLNLEMKGLANQLAGKRFLRVAGRL